MLLSARESMLDCLSVSTTLGAPAARISFFVHVEAVVDIALVCAVTAVHYAAESVSQLNKAYQVIKRELTATLNNIGCLL